MKAIELSNIPAELTAAEEYLKKEGLRYITSAMHRGYISRKVEHVPEQYAGRYGDGVKLHTPSWKSTQYHNVSYWVR